MKEHLQRDLYFAEQKLAAQSATIAALTKALEAVTDRLDYICTRCDDGFVNNSDWDIIAEARASLLAATPAAEGEG